jgi:hypothetical protein
MMVLAPALAAKVAAGQELAEHGAEEVEIRAATIAIADAVVARANAGDGDGGGGGDNGGNSNSGRGGLGLGLTVARFDYFCWRSAVVAEEAGELAEFPFHRTRTIAY